MPTFLLTWNPKRWHWDEEDYENTVTKTRRGEAVASDWSSGNTRRIAPGDRVFLLRQGTDRGIIGVGRATSASQQTAHWDESRQGEKSWCVNWQIEVLLPTADRLAIEELMAADLGVPWNNLVASGVQVPLASEEQLGTLWCNHLARVGYRQ